MLYKKKNCRFYTKSTVGKWSERRDLNPRQPAPKAGALPDCATPRNESRRTVGTVGFGLLVHLVFCDAARDFAGHVVLGGKYANPDRMIDRLVR